MSDKLFPRKVVVVLFYDKNLNLLVQKRNSHSKVGENYGFFGGGIEEGESPEVALRRELAEELNYKPVELKYWGKYSFRVDLPDSKFHGNIRYGDLFFSPITPELLKSASEDDTEPTLIPTDRVFENRGKEFGPVIFIDTQKIKEELIKLTKS